MKKNYLIKTVIVSMIIFMILLTACSKTNNGIGDFKSIYAAVLPDKTIYEEGEVFIPDGMEIRGVYSNGTDEIILGYTYSPTRALLLSDKIVTISYEELTAAIDIIVNPAAAFDMPQQALDRSIFVQSTDGTDDGIENLIDSMEQYGLKFYQNDENPKGLIAADDVVLLKINCQYTRRGGTNTDVLKSFIQVILDHPDNFTGEIIVADNGQRQWSAGPYGGGSLDWDEPNSKDRNQSTMDVVNYFKNQGVKISGELWDAYSHFEVAEFSEGDYNNGFVGGDIISNAGNWQVTWAKFTSEYGTQVSFKNGIWDTGSNTYNYDKLKVVNMPVLKAHMGANVTACLKNYFGTISFQIFDGHSSMYNGGWGAQMLYSRYPVLNLLDMVWIGPDRRTGPHVSYGSDAVEVNKVAVSLDPIAMDYWAAKHILMPAAANFPQGASRMNPDITSENFGRALMNSYNVLKDAGKKVTMTESEILIFNNGKPQFDVSLID